MAGTDKKVYAYTLTNQVSAVVDQLIGQLRTFAQTWEPKELEFPFEVTERASKEDRKHKVLRLPRRARRVLCLTSVNLSLFLLKASGLLHKLGMS